MESINCTKCGSTDVYFNSIEGVYVCKNCDSKFSNAEFEEEHNTKHLIARLKECQRVLDESVAIRKVTKHQTAQDYINACNNEAPAKYPMPTPIKYKKIYDFSSKKLKTIECVFWVVSVCLLILFMVIHFEEVLKDSFAFLVICVVFFLPPLVIFYCLFDKMIKNKQKYINYINEKEEYNKSLLEIRKWKAEKEKEYQEIATDENKEKYEQNVIWMNKQNDILPPMYYSRVSDLIEILEGKRADTIKEAINVMVADDYQKKLVNDQKMHIYEQEQLMKAQLESLQQTQLAAEKAAEEAARATRQSNNRY